MNEFDPDYKIHPGVTIREYMEWAFAEVTEIPLETLTRLFDGSEPLTPEIAAKLETATGTPAHFWLNYEAAYRKEKEKE